MIKCKEFVHHVSHDDHDGWKKRPGMWLHFFICIHCRRYVEQLAVLKKGIKEYFNLKKEKDSLEVKNIEDKVLKNIFKENSKGE